MTIADRRRYDVDAQMRALAECDDRGVPLAGRVAEIAALRQAGARDVSLGRIFEGHLNGAQLVARCGNAAQRAALRGAIDAGELLGVWNTQEGEPVRIEPHAGAYVLRGAKTWASGAGSIGRPLITAAWPDGSVQMCWLSLRGRVPQVDASRWRPLGMAHSDSFRVVFDGLTVTASELVGEPGMYEQQPWFFGGALRFAAVQTGVIDRLVAETVGYLQTRGRDGDLLQCARVAEMRIANRTAAHWLAAGEAAWTAFDGDPSARNAAEVLDVADMARTAVERAALDAIERAVRSVGARGLVEPLPFAGLVRDLHMYLRQPAPDAALLRVGRAAFGAPPASGAP